MELLEEEEEREKKNCLNKSKVLSFLSKNTGKVPEKIFACDNVQTCVVLCNCSSPLCVFLHLHTLRKGASS